MECVITTKKACQANIPGEDSLDDMEINPKYQEYLEVWNWETALPTGARIDRDTAHREGIPHESVHLWVLRKNNEDTEILFQHRAANKEIYPDCLDITVGGHVPYGFTGNKILKETDEEIGICPDENDLIDLGWYRYEEKSGRFFQRELQHVFLLKNDRQLDRYCFRDSEVSGIYAVKLQDLKEILAFDVSIKVKGFSGNRHVEKSIARVAFHPQLFDDSMKTYMDVVIKAAGELVSTGHVMTRMPPL
jgi:isopentenyldiphosphate isomerase